MLKNTTLSGFADEIDQKLDVQMELLNQLGISYLELRSAEGISVSKFTRKEAKEIQQKLTAKGIKVSAIGSPIGKIGIKDDFAAHLEEFKHVLELADLFGTRYIRMFSFRIPTEENPADYRGKVVDQLGIMVDYAKKQDMILLHENEKGIYGDVATRCLDIMEQLSNEHFKFTFDFANFIQCKQDTMEAYELLKNYIAYIHIKDAIWKTGEVVPAGLGDGKVKEILQKLDESGYSGFLSLEPHLQEFDFFKHLEQTGEGNLIKGMNPEITDGRRAFTAAYQALMRMM